jgi:hypothetical protein
MAKQETTEFEFDPDYVHPGTPRYDWKNWANGRVWKLESGVDYDDQKALIAAARTQARRHGLRFRWQPWLEIGAGMGIHLQFWPQDQPEPPREAA